MAATQEANKTKDHDTIKNWVEERDGRPTVVEETDGLLRIEFETTDNAELEEISWDRFFEIFDENDLQFLYHDKEDSTFCKFISAN